MAKEFILLHPRNPLLRLLIFSLSSGSQTFDRTEERAVRNELGLRIKLETESWFFGEIDFAIVGEDLVRE